MSEVSQEQPQTTEAKQKQLVDYLKDFASAPTHEQIEQWKVSHGEVFVSGFSETEIYVWRALKRPEWLELQTLQLDQAMAEEWICNKCLLWKSVSVAFAQSKAGTVSTLHEMILQQSNFMAPNVAMMLVAKL